MPVHRARKLGPHISGNVKYAIESFLLLLACFRCLICKELNGHATCCLAANGHVEEDSGTIEGCCCHGRGWLLDLSYNGDTG